MDALIVAMVVLYLGASLALHVYGINCYVMMGLFLRGNAKRKREEQSLRERFDMRESDLPIITTQLPVYNEANVIERLLRAVAAFDYPKTKHEIQLLDDSTDETNAIATAVVAELRADGHDIQHIRREKRVGYKAGALAEGMLRAKGEFIAIFDADFVPPPTFLRKCLPFLTGDPRCGFVQTRWGHRNRDYSLLTRLQGIGIDGHFIVEQAARAWTGLCFNFNGTAGIWRREAIDDAGGWQSDTITEDLDLSYRVLLRGWRPRYLLDEITPAELPTDINALKSQQSRWAKGSIQTALKLLPTIWGRGDLGLFVRLQATLHLTHYLIHPFILIVTLLILPLILLLQARFANLYVTPLIVLMFLALFGPSTLYVFSQAVSRGKVLQTLLLLPALMGMGIGLAVNNTGAVIGALRGTKSEFVRTPKLGTGAEAATGERALAAVAGSGGVTTLAAAPTISKSYRLPLSRLCAMEILVGLWALLACLVSFAFQGGAAARAAGPFLLVQACGFMCVGVLSILHDRNARKRIC